MVLVTGNTESGKYQLHSEKNLQVIIYVIADLITRVWHFTFEFIDLKERKYVDNEIEREWGCSVVLWLWPCPHITSCPADLRCRSGGGAVRWHRGLDLTDFQAGNRIPHFGNKILELATSGHAAAAIATNTKRKLTKTTTRPPPPPLLAWALCLSNIRTSWGKYHESSRNISLNAASW